MQLPRIAQLQIQTSKTNTVRSLGRVEYRFITVLKASFNTQSWYCDLFSQRTSAKQFSLCQLVIPVLLIQLFRKAKILLIYLLLLSSANRRLSLLELLFKNSSNHDKVLESPPTFNYVKRYSSTINCSKWKLYYWLFFIKPFYQEFKSCLPCVF